MRKFKGGLMIVLCSLFLILWLLVFLGILYSRLKNPENSTPIVMTTENIIGSVFIVFFIALSIVGLIKGLKKIRTEEPVPIIDFSDTLDINLTGRILYKDYRNFILKSTFNKRIHIIFACLLPLYLLFYIINGIKSDIMYLIIPWFLICFILPIFVLRNTKRIYQTNKIFQEQLNYKLTNDAIHITGDTIDSIQKWKNFYEMKETKVFFVFYQDKTHITGTFLDKKMFTNDELTTFKQFIRSLNLK
jgi:Ca2+/Na+ antiporter